MRGKMALKIFVATVLLYEISPRSDGNLFNYSTQRDLLEFKCPCLTYSLVNLSICGSSLFVFRPSTSCGSSAGHKELRIPV